MSAFNRCRKVFHFSRESAERAMRRAFGRTRAKDRGTVTSVYLCCTCGCWHWGHQRPRQNKMEAA